MRIKVFSLSLSTWYQSQGRKLYSFWFIRVINSGNPSSVILVTFSIFQSFPVNHIVVRKPSSPSTFFRGYFPATFFPAIFSDTNHIIRSAKRRSATFLKAPEPKTDPRASHAPFFSGGLNPTHRHMRARGPLSGVKLLPAGSSGTVLHF